MQLLPATIYYGQIERIRGASAFVLAREAPAGEARSFPPFLYEVRGPARPTSGFVRAATTNSSGKKENNGYLWRMPVVPLADSNREQAYTWRASEHKNMHH